MALLLIAPAALAAPTRAEYIAQVDPICAAADQDIAEIMTGYMPAIENGRWGRAGRKLLRAVSRFRASMNEIRSIEPPSEDAALIAEWLSLADLDARVTARRGRALKRGELKLWKRLGRRSQRLEQEIVTLLAGYGFKHCA